MLENNRVAHRYNLWDFLPLASVLLLVIALTIKFWNWDFDDGFIVYRYVGNILAGSGWVYNPGESYNASTSVLNTVLIAIIATSGISPTAAAHVLGAVSLFLLGTSFYLIVRYTASRWFSGAVASTAVFLMANNFTWGLESNLFYGLLCAWIACELYGKTSWLLLGLLVLVRPDALILVFFRAAISFFQGRLPVRGLVTVLAVLAPWAIFSLIKFGNVFPATLQQKMWQGSSGFWGSGWIFLKGLVNYVRGDTFIHLAGVHWHPVVLCAPLVLLPQGLLYCLSRCPRVLMLAFYVFSILAIYTVLNVPNYHWYYVGLIPVAVLFAAYGVLFVSEWIHVRTHPLLDLVLCIPLLVITMVAVRTTKPDFLDVRTDVYRKLSEQIVAATPAENSIAAVEVGVVGYFTGRKMVDIVGLTTPYGEFITGRNNQKLFREIQPGVIIMHHPLMPHEQAVYGDAQFAEHYRQRDLVAFPGYSELAFFERATKESGREFSLQRVNQNDMAESSPGVFTVRSGDPWLEYQLEQPQSLSHPVLTVEYEVSGPGLAKEDVTIGRVYRAAPGEGYAEENAVPFLVKAGGEQRATIMLQSPGTAQTKSTQIQRVRIDIIQDMRLAADTIIRVKSVAVRELK